MDNLNEITKMLDRKISIMLPPESEVIKNKSRVFGMFWSGKVKELKFDKLANLEKLDFQDVIYQGR
jgi:hypothetical protein